MAGPLTFHTVFRQTGLYFFMNMENYEFLE